MATAEFKYNPELLPVVRAWWGDRHLGAMPPELLPPCGMCALDPAGDPVAAGWLYEPRGAVAFIDWLIAKPGMTAAQTRRALRAVAFALENIAISGGYRWIMGSVCNPVMLRECLAVGYEPAAEGVWHLTKKIR